MGLYMTLFMRGGVSHVIDGETSILVSTVPFLPVRYWENYRTSLKCSFLIYKCSFHKHSSDAHYVTHGVLGIVQGE